MICTAEHPLIKLIRIGEQNIMIEQTGNYIKLFVSLLLASVWAGLMFVVALVTFFQMRNIYRTMSKWICLLILRVWGIRLRVHPSKEPLPAGQKIYISNHTSTLDVLIIIALGLSNCRYFLSGFLRYYIPVGIIATVLGTFYTCPQSQPEKRIKIFKRAQRILQKTGESVYLSPEGERITTGEIGHFNKGAFHLATNLKAPLCPFYIRIPNYSNPGLGFFARPGGVDVFFEPAIITDHWQLEDLMANKEMVRQVFVGYNRQWQATDA
ncbi:MAG: 1-acyl-sn-glycerol-3-phosphate acyltransferase [Candidatus Electrothrix sp. AR4]|nr:1-acyl-sn-glycerol-3-phosphate acyltransferase [Candidatus Electrothrix sp. AR4]